MHLQLIILLFIKIMFYYSQANALGSESDRLALLEFKRGITHDPLDVLRSWNDSIHFCSWRGISCSRRRERVTALNFRSLNLQGTMSPHIGNLTFLNYVDLANNSFSGEIPPDVGRLFRLQQLFLVTNKFTGEIPAQLSNCSQLRTLNLGRNKLVGRIPPELGSLTKLQVLQFSDNNLTGSIPPSVGNLSSLLDFYVAFNKLDGSIPDDIGRLKSMSLFAAEGNKLSGELPATFYNISSLAYISIAANKLNGTLPASIGTLTNLKFLGIGGNEFSGPIPNPLSNASKLEAIDIAGNHFVGLVPRDLGKLKNLERLALDDNHFGSNSTGDLGFLSSLTNITQLQLLDFGYNLFGGSLPTSIANLSSTLTQLYLGENQISGVIPQTLDKYTKLQVLDMAGNLFTGTIPSNFGRFRNLQGLALDRNRLSGSVPSSFGNLTQLVQLYLSENKIIGSIPPSIGNCKYLQLLDIASNGFTGAIPKEVMSLSSLQLLLNVSQNSLTGNLPLQVGNLKGVNKLDFSENNLSGEIPSTIGECESLEYLNLRGNSFQEVIPSSLASLKGLTYLDLSRNNLSGTISKDLQNLRFLLYFNASFNDLEGELPTEGVFRNASAISVIGNNKLCGGVPELQLPACPNVKSKKQRISHAMKLVIISASVLLCLFLLSSLLVLYWRRKSKKALSIEDQDHYHHPQVSYKVLHDGTGGFSRGNLLGSGSFGTVYKGILNQDEREVAIKVFNLHDSGASKSFIAECMALRHIRHRNLVKIITSCSSIDYQGNDFKALVFEFMKNSSLEEWLHPRVDSGNQSRKLNFLQRLNIALNVAHALHYLHIECEPPIIHCDLKPSNVLLDSDMVAHVGDFGLARILSTTNGIAQNQSSTIGLKGSIGYAAPEYGMGGPASIQGDMYSYGILLLEMFTGKRPTDEIFKEDVNIHQYVSLALPERSMQIVDPSLLLREVEEQAAASIEAENNINSRIVAQVEVNSSENVEMEKCLHSILELGLACSMEPLNERMKMGEVIKALLLIKSAFLGAITNRPRINQL